MEENYDEVRVVNSTPLPTLLTEHGNTGNTHYLLRRLGLHRHSQRRSDSQEKLEAKFCSQSWKQGSDRQTDAIGGHDKSLLQHAVVSRRTMLSPT